MSKSSFTRFAERDIGLVSEPSASERDGERNRTQATPVATSLGRIRRRLTAWYVGTLLAVLVLLGIGLFATITARLDHELDQSLEQEAHEVARLARSRADAGARVALDSLNDLGIPERQLFLLDTLGQFLGRSTSADWIGRLARDAWHGTGSSRVHAAQNDTILRAHAEVSRSANGTPFIAVAVANEIELEDRYTSLIVLFSLASVAGVMLVAAGGWLLARKSTAPVEDAFGHMRRFMADAAHELRTPLTIVRGRAELALKRSRSSDEYVDALRAIEHESERVSRIVEDLLMLARADAGDRTLERTRVFLDDVALDAAEAARVMAAAKSIRIEVGTFEETPVLGDAILLRQLVMILLDNAIKFSASGSTVRISVGAVSGTGVLTVSDEGSGIAAEHLPHVFDRFYRADSARRREADSGRDGRSNGTGLGLSIARWIAEQHHATIAIDSRVHEGTRVVVTFARVSSLADSSNG